MRIALACFAALLLGCPSTVQDEKSGAGGGSSSGHAHASTGADMTSSAVIATAVSTGTGGGSSVVVSTGVGPVTSTGVGGGVTSSTGVGGSSISCGAFFHIVDNNGAEDTLSSICEGDPGADQTKEPDGYRFAGGPVGAPHGITVSGCASPSHGAKAVHLNIANEAGPGDYMAGDAVYIDDAGVTWSITEQFEVFLAKIDDVGGAIEGKYHAQVSFGGDAAIEISGDFRVCHVHDQFAP